MSASAAQHWQRQALQAALARVHAQQSPRVRLMLDGPQQPLRQVDGRELLTFCSNDYLGLAADPRLAEALAEGARRYGVGSGAAQLIVGHSPAHRDLEDALARFLGRERALLFATGYQANLAIVQTLTESLAHAGAARPRLFADRLSHASLLDGARLSGGHLRRYPHRDHTHLARLLAKAEPGALILTDGLFSMDGDLAPLPELAALAASERAWLLVDDAHGLGTFGPDGRGTLAHFGLAATSVPILVGTLGKAFGTFGAFVAGEAALIEILLQRARGYLYTTAPPPALAHATLTALELARCEDWRRDRLRALIQRFRAGAEALCLPLLPSDTPIQPLLAGTVARALAWSTHLRAQGLLVAAIRPPTVPPGGARLRITFSASHTEAQVDRLLAALATLPECEASEP